MNTQNIHPFLKKLLNGATVEWKPLTKVCNDHFWIMPATPYYTETGIPYITSKNIKNGFIDFSKTKYISEESYVDISKNRPIYEDDILISMIGTIGLVSRVNSEDLPFYGQNMYLLRLNKNIINIKYFLHYFLSYDVKYQLKKSKKNIGQGYLKANDIYNIQIPIPPLAVQSELVKILDKFTELTAELTARKKQYAYYRDKLLTFADDAVEWKALGEVANINRGKRLVKSELEEKGKYAVFQNSMSPLGYYHESNAKANTTFIISAGSAGEIGFSKFDFWAADDVYYFITPENLKNKFLYYFLLTKQYKIKSKVRRASVPRLSKNSFEKIKIPIPPLAEQERIVNILDKFDTLTNSISEGIPREIELRKKQYEYYRDKLLTFPKATTDAHG